MNTILVGNDCFGKSIKNFKKEPAAFDIWMILVVSQKRHIIFFSIIPVLMFFKGSRESQQRLALHNPFEIRSLFGKHIYGLGVFGEAIIIESKTLGRFSPLRGLRVGPYNLLECL